MLHEDTKEKINKCSTVRNLQTASQEKKAIAFDIIGIPSSDVCLLGFVFICPTGFVTCETKGLPQIQSNSFFARFCLQLRVSPYLDTYIRVLIFYLNTNNTYMCFVYTLFTKIMSTDQE